MASTTFRLEWHAADALNWLEWSGGGVVSAFPTRAGGVSAPPYDSLNLGLSVGDDPEAVLENRRRFAAAVGLDAQWLVVPGQVHGTRLAEVGAADAGRGARDRESVVAETDGLVTATPHLGLCVSYADCVPVVIVAESAGGPVLATVHGGWRGMLAGIVEQAAAALTRRGRLLGAVVGPSIGPCCFTVDDALRDRFEARFPGATGDASVDLWVCARAGLEAAGVPPAAITVTGLCTSCDGRFYSHRRDHGRTGRHLAVAFLEEA